jgi:hypothetical protein
MPLYAIDQVDPDLLHTRAIELGMEPDSTLEEIKFESARRLLASQTGAESTMKKVLGAIGHLFGWMSPRRQSPHGVAGSSQFCRQTLG